MATLEDAKRKLPLPLLMNQYGHAVPADCGKYFKCPFCEKKAAKIRGTGQLWFKCSNDTCRSGTAVPRGGWDEVRFYGWQHQLSTASAVGQYSEAAVAFMKEAGVWKDKAAIPSSTLPGAQRRHNPIPKPPAAPETEDEEMVQSCIEVVLAERKASVSLLQRRLRIGYGRATRMMAELEQRGVVGPANGVEAREILLAKPALPVAAAADAAVVPASVAPDQKISTSEQSHIEGTGAAELASEAAAGLAPVSAPSVQITGVPAGVVPQVIDPMLPKPIAKEKDPTGVLAMREFYAGLALNDRDREILTTKRGLTTVTMEALGCRSNPRTNRELIDRLTTERGMKEMLAAGFWLPPDRKRKLPQRINSQFHGKGQAGKKAKADRRNASDKIVWGWVEPILIPYFDEKGDLIALRPHKGGAPATTALGGKSLYIPRAGMPNQIFRRLVNGNIDEEKFETVIITEGEFKAMALWQTVGHGARQFMDAESNPLFRDEEAMGVCAVPGITYAKHFETREILEDWLRVVGCRHAIVAFDYEVKSDPEKFPEAFEAERRDRYQTQIYARYLAVQLQKKLPLRASTCVLPAEWLNAKGKADWDGALADLTSQPTEESTE